MSNFFLTQKDAESREGFFSGAAEYNVYLRLNKGEEYHGLVEVSFGLKSKTGVFIDVNVRRIAAVSLNGNAWAEADIKANYKDGMLKFPEAQLLEGANSLAIRFENNYSHDGNGLHTYLDQDGAQYGYCQTEPYSCNRIFPVFDQPDLKGQLTFLISAPADWRVISNSCAAKAAPACEFAEDNKFFGQAKEAFPADFTEKEFTTTLFNKTPHLSSYLFAFTFGPFMEIKSQDTDTVPMSIFCRASLFKYAEAQEKKIFVFPKEGIKFYESFFHTKYPFEKYDMVFCPEYTVGAMEYPGVITFNDLLIVRDEPTAVQISRLGSVNLHELAHMWFGNLVTLKWWNDLWLNESFADFVCYLSGHFIQDKLGFESIDFMTELCIRKNWGYNEDQMVTTHPIACEVSNTSKAESIFDGITYSKGASVMKQLYFILGHESFSRNLGVYFSKYAWKNATLTDLLGELSKSSDPSHAVDLEEWNRTWIGTAGLNIVEAVWQSGSKQVTIRQSAAMEQHPTLRTHKLKVAFFDAECKVVKVEEVLVQPKFETAFTTTAEGFVAVLPNYEDWDFVRISLDSNSAKFFMQNLAKLDTLNKMLVIRGFYEMVRDAKLKATDFIDSMLTNVLGKNNDQLSLKTTLDYILASKAFIPENLVKAPMRRVFEALLDLLKLEKDADKVKILQHALIASAHCEDSYRTLKAILEEDPETIKLKLNIRDKWNILVKVFKAKKISDVQKNILRNHLSTLDTSDLKKDYSLTLDAIIATPEQMSALWSEFTSENRKFSFQDIEHTLSGFFENKSRILKSEYFEKFFEDFPLVANRDPKEIGKNFFDALQHTFEMDLAIQKLEKMKEVVSASKEFHQINISKSIDVIKRLKKTHHLYTVHRHVEEFIFSSEQVSDGHPDKLCDFISDSLLDAYLEKDPESMVAIETLTKGNMVVVAGEVTSKANVDIEAIVRQSLEKVGYDDAETGIDPKTCQVQQHIYKQSPEIRHSVHEHNELEDLRAGDQGLMLGYATNETPELMPLTLVYATRLLKEMKKAREDKSIPWLRPDAKSQVAIRYTKDDRGNIRPLFVENILISTQHARGIDTATIRKVLREQIIDKVIAPNHMTKDTRIIINPSDSFVVGGPAGDAGVTGRKIIADTYGGWGGHGGGAFSGKDPSKVDRSAAYAARWAAKSLVAAGLCTRVLVQVSYAIGLKEPLSLFVDSYGTVKEGLTDNDLVDALKRHFNLSPGSIINELGLRKPVYSSRCTYGHFLQNDATWEQIKPITGHK